MALSRSLPLLLALAALSGAAGAKPDDDSKRPPSVEHYTVRAEDSTNLALEPPELPDLTGYTGEAVKDRIKTRPKGRVEIQRMVSSPVLREFVGGDGRLAEWAARQHTNPVAIFIEGGYMTPADLAKALPESQFEQVDKNTYIARLPIVVSQGSTLHIEPGTTFRLSEERGAFLVNDGKLFVTSAHVMGWREQRNGPATFRSKKQFRPFVLAWGGSETYIHDSIFVSLGYAASKSYGVSLSQYTPSQAPIMKRTRPTGWILESTFSDIYYGFYCYEADDVVIVGNLYYDNIVYGIDPHDRSNRLIIAHNTTIGMIEKHGIIISREVNDSWIFRNRTSRNRLAGIVIDRHSSNNVIAYNDVFDNHGDGISIYESGDNLLWNNRVFGNARHGIRLRNSVDVRLYDNIVVGNGLAGIKGHVKDLTGTDRNLKLDPFELHFSMVVVGGQLVYNGTGPFAIDRPLSMELYNVEMLAPPKKSGVRLSGFLERYQLEILDILVRQRKAVVIEPVDPARKQGA